MSLTKKEMDLRVERASWFVGLAGALGVGLQNFMAFVSFLLDLGGLSSAAVLGIAATFGGFISGLVNLWMNVDLLKDFFKRFTGNKVQEKLRGWKKFRYYLGCLLFITTGILFGMTAFAFGGVGVLAGLAIASGLLVAIIMMIQELETWLQSFDEAGAKTSLKEAFVKWWKGLSPAKAVGFCISVGNILALSLLFALGITNFLIMAGVPLFPAIIVSLVVAFTAGAFTEFYFYNSILSSFCEQIATVWWKAFLELSFKVKATVFLSSLINAAVNGVLCYAGVVLFNALLVSVGMSPMGLGIIITASIFAAAASYMLGVKFWVKYFNPKVESYLKPFEKGDSLEVMGNAGGRMSPSAGKTPSVYEAVPVDNVDPHAHAHADATDIDLLLPAASK